MKIEIQDERDFRANWPRAQYLLQRLGLYADTDNPDGIDIENLREYASELYHLMVAIRHYWFTD